jgi:RbsD/FucU transport protein family protein
MTNHNGTWQQILRERLPVYGHRNWIVVADSAYPAHAAPGIETITAGADLICVLASVLAQLDGAPHLYPTIYTDRELPFIPEEDAPGVSNFRRLLMEQMESRVVEQLPHDEILAEVDKAGRLFQVLIIKTCTTIPYTSVFLELGCGYWNPGAERRLREALAAEERRAAADTVEPPPKIVNCNA